jgi:hypothetical protein
MGSESEHGVDATTASASATTAAPTAAPMGPAGPPKRRRSWLVGAGVVGTLLVGGAIGLGVRAYVHRGPRFPLPLSTLPDSTTELHSSTLREAIAKRLSVEASAVPAEALWSTQSEVFCGGRDLFKKLLGDDGYVTFSMVDDLDELKASLACGKAIVDANGTDPSYTKIYFKAGKERRISSVEFIDGKMENLPDSKHLSETKDPEGFRHSRCKSTPAAKTEDPNSKDGPCERVFAKLGDRPLWGVSAYERLNSFGMEFSAEGKNKPDEAEAFERVLKQQAWPTYWVGLGNEGAIGLPRPDDKALEEELDKSLKEARVSASSTLRTGGFESKRFELVMGSASDAKDVVRLLEKSFKSAKRKLKDKLDETKRGLEASDIEDPIRRESWRLNREHREAALRVEIRALEEAKFEVDAKLVTVTLTARPENEDKEAWAALAQHRGELMTHAAAVIRAIAEGQPPPKEHVSALGQQVSDAFDPPAAMDSPLKGLRVPGRGKCLIAEGSPICFYEKTLPAETLKKLRTVAEGDGFVVEDAGDNSLSLSKKDDKDAVFLVKVSTNPFNDKETVVTLQKVSPK